jgi:histidyl-tRNA synthetase
VSITKARREADAAAKVRRNEVDVYVMAFGGASFNGMIEKRIKICTALWNQGIKV